LVRQNNLLIQKICSVLIIVAGNCPWAYQGFLFQKQLQKPNELFEAVKALRNKSFDFNAYDFIFTGIYFSINKYSRACR